MSKIFSIKLLQTILMVLFLFVATSQTFIFAKGIDDARKGLNTTAQKSFGDDVVDGPNISQIIGKVIGVVLSFVGVIFLILTIYAGFTWMLARGNEAEAKKAKDLMFDAVIGLIIILAAYAITAFVGNSLAN